MFERYRLSSSYDEMLDGDKNIRPHWETLVKNLETLGVDQLIAKQKEIDWRLEDNGVTYNVYNDPDGMNRPWRLDPIPLLIDEAQWKTIETGLKQRARLLDMLLRDIYGEQRVIQEGIIPMEVIYAHGGFMREVFGLSQQSLMIYGADMARGPDGKMWVISDRTQAPSGLGYAIENRLTMNSAIPDLYNDLSIRRLHPFFEKFKSTLAGLNPHAKGGALNVLLSPGAHNETYFEHSYLSSFLGLTLVQGQDLLVKGGSVWLKSLKGLRRVDGIIRRVDETYCDPLELRNDSQLGVSGLVQAVRQNGVSMLNSLGCGVLENLGLNPFMPHLARYYLKEELILPQIATWWCGQEKERKFVLENLDRLIVKTIDRSGDEPHVYSGKCLSKPELKALHQKILEQPYRYVGQEEVEFATSPALVGKTIEPRKVVIRAYTIAGSDGFEVMAGALVRVGASNDSLMVSGQSGGSSKDLWVIGDSSDEPKIPIFKSKGAFGSSLETIPSLRAENLFWLGRYLMRSILTARMIRTTVKYMANAYRYDHHSNLKVQDVFTKALTHLTMTYPGFLGSNPALIQDPLQEIWSVSIDEWRVGTLGHTIKMLSGANTSTKNLLPLEAWRIFDRMTREYSDFGKGEKPPSRIIISTLDKTLIQLMAYKELIEESLFDEQGLVLYEIGAGIERSLMLIAKARALLIFIHEPISEYEILEMLLGTCESLNAYRAHYRSSIELRSVTEFLLLDIKFPKSLISELDRLMRALPKLPKFRNATYLTRYEEPIFEAFSMLRLSKIDRLCSIDSERYVRAELDILLSGVADKLIVAFHELSQIYFAHYDE